MAIETRRFSLFNVDGKNNKFWNITLQENGDVEVHFGPQGKTGQRKVFPNAGRSFFEKKIREKTSSKHENGAYVENQVLETAGSSSSAKVVDKHTLAQKAVKDIGADQPELQKLIHYFAEVNAHNLYEASGGKITYDTSTGHFKTTQGVVTLDQVQQARKLLNAIDGFAANNDFSSTEFKSVLNPYLSIIPQKGLVRQMDFPSMFGLNGGLHQQNDILDSLESSYATVIANAQKPSENKNVVENRLFKVKLEDASKKEFDYLHKYYNESKGGHRDVAIYNTKRVWRLTIEHMAIAFAEKVSEMQSKANIMKLWHGSKCSNVLSILKAGMIIPPASSSHCSGRAYGNGLYFSDMSSKSIRYATGAWGHGGGSIDRKFMFLVDVAMGNMHTPNTGGYNSSYKPPKGCDSCFAKAGISGVQNNEMIVYNLSQANPVFLAEFTPYGK